MFYIAKCYVGHAGTTVRPGEAFEADSQDDKINWLLSQKAIVPATPAFSPANDDDAQEEAAPGDTLDDDMAPAEDTEEDAPEIDGLDGIIAEAEVAEEAPVKKGRKKA